MPKSDFQKNQGVFSFMKKLFSFLSAVFLLAFFICGCASDKSAESPLDPGKFDNMPKRHTKKTVQKISADTCDLKIPHDLTATAGTAPELPVMLIYHGFKTLDIQEWYMLDQYNFKFHYRRVEPNKPNSKKAPFKIYRVKPPKNANRSGLILNRNNRAALSIKVPFIGEMQPGENALFEIYISTTLKTFALQSNRMLIRTK